MHARGDIQRRCKLASNAACKCCSVTVLCNTSQVFSACTCQTWCHYAQKPGPMTQAQDAASRSGNILYCCKMTVCLSAAGAASICYSSAMLPITTV